MKAMAKSTIAARVGALILFAAAASQLPLSALGAEATFDLEIENGRVRQSMRTIRVKQGDVVKLRWTADRPIVLHLHGYDIEKKVEPGTVSEMTFEARATGRFPVEEHEPNTKGGHSHGEAPLVRIEVRPR
jgi:FtsP/CotA-like multicopper oxidase with cupredoxin domain